MAYEADNIFAKILRGEMPSHKVYENDKTFCFMDIMPRTNGHSLIIPKSQVRNIFDASQDDLSDCLATVQKIAKASMMAFAADGIVVQQFNEAASGQVVFHLHFHVLPRFEGIELLPPGQMAENDVLSENAEKLRAALNS